MALGKPWGARLPVCPAVFLHAGSGSNSDRHSEKRKVRKRNAVKNMNILGAMLHKFLLSLKILGSAVLFSHVPDGVTFGTYTI